MKESKTRKGRVLFLDHTILHPFDFNSIVGSDPKVVAFIRHILDMWARNSAQPEHVTFKQITEKLLCSPLLLAPLEGSGAIQALPHKI